jgi:hypothetical protein
VAALHVAAQRVAVSELLWVTVRSSLIHVTQKRVRQIGSKETVPCVPLQLRHGSRILVQPQLASHVLPTRSRRGRVQRRP